MRREIQGRPSAGVSLGEKLHIPEPELTGMLQKYCDMRRRDFTQTAIRTNAQWPRRYLNLLLEEATRRDMPGS